MSRVLVTGVSGFAGSHLAELLLDLGHAVIGSIRTRSPRENLTAARLVDRTTLIPCDLRDAKACHELVCQAEPDYIAHLAADSWVGGSWNHPTEIYQNNVIAQVNLLEAVRLWRVEPTKILIAGSSEEYGLVHPDELPIREEQPLRPLSPYAVSKVAQDLMGYQYRKSYGLPIVRARAFNHEGPRRGVHFAPSNFCYQVAMIEAGIQAPVITVGNLDARRDFTDVRDVVRAYWMLLERGQPGEVYNIGSGVATSIAAVLNRIRDLSTALTQIRQEPGRMRPSDVPVLAADATKIRAMGWAPTIPLGQTLEDCLHWWRSRV